MKQLHQQTRFEEERFMEISIQRIMFPTDFSDLAKIAQHYAMSLADRFGAELHLMHVVAPLMPYPDVSSPWIMPESELQHQIDAADQRLRRVVDFAWLENHSSKFTTVVGFAVDEILKYASDQNIDLIVVGTHGHTGLSHFLIGSVAEKIVRTASCPVLTVHPKGHQFLIGSENE